MASRWVARGMIASWVASAGQVAGDPSLAHHDDAVAQAQDLGQLGGDHDDRLALPGEVVEQPVDFALGADVDAARRLVEDQDLACRRISHLAMTTFCWLPPERLRTFCWRLGVLIARLLDLALGASPGCARLVDRPSRPSEPTQATPARCWSRRPCRARGRIACGPRTGSRCRARTASGGLPMCDRLAVDEDLAAVGADRRRRWRGRPRCGRRPPARRSRGSRPCGAEADVADLRPRLRPRTSSTTSSSRCSGISGVASKIVRPTIIEMICSIGASAVGTVPTYRRRA